MPTTFVQTREELMTRKPADDAIRHTVVVGASPERAFEVFTMELAVWWPPAYTWSKDVLDTIAIEAHEGGRCYERGPRGFECDWGRVLVYEPPHRLVFFWQISPERVPEPDSTRASVVELRFEEDAAEKTRVELEHRGFERHGQGAEDYREAMGSKQGWPHILSRYVEAVD